MDCECKANHSSNEDDTINHIDSTAVTVTVFGIHYLTYSSQLLCEVDITLLLRRGNGGEERFSKLSIMNSKNDSLRAVDP